MFGATLISQSFFLLQCQTCRNTNKLFFFLKEKWQLKERCLTPENRFLLKLDTERQGAKVIKALNKLAWAQDYLDGEKKATVVAKQEADSNSDAMAT